jgi:hypothetical protein
MLTATSSKPVFKSVDDKLVRLFSIMKCKTLTGFDDKDFRSVTTAVNFPRKTAAMSLYDTFKMRDIHAATTIMRAMDIYLGLTWWNNAREVPLQTFYNLSLTLTVMIEKVDEQKRLSENYDFAAFEKETEPMVNAYNCLMDFLRSTPLTLFVKEFGR